MARNTLNMEYVSFIIKKELAQKYEDFCRKHNAYTIEITKHAVKLK